MPPEILTTLLTLVAREPKLRHRGDRVVLLRLRRKLRLGNLLDLLLMVEFVSKKKNQ